MYWLFKNLKYIFVNKRVSKIKPFVVSCVLCNAKSKYRHTRTLGLSSSRVCKRFIARLNQLNISTSNYRLNHLSKLIMRLKK